MIKRFGIENGGERNEKVMLSSDVLEALEQVSKEDLKNATASNKDQVGISFTLLGVFLGMLDRAGYAITKKP